MKVGRIIKGIAGFYYVVCDDTIYECKAKGILRKREMAPLIGDFVEISILDEVTPRGVVDKVLDRKNSLVRPTVANVDQLMIVIPCKSPEPDLMLIDKLIITAKHNNITPILILNKTDLVSSEIAEKYVAQYRETGIKIIETNIIDKDNLDIIKDDLKDCVTAFAGQSGVGKSTILNQIFEQIVMPTGVVSEKISRGKHTTRHAELFPLDNGGFIVDTPGFSSFELAQVGYESVQDYYDEYQKLADDCKFRGCLHINEPDCAVKHKVENGNLSSKRYQRYVEIVKQEKEKYDNRWR